MDSSTKPGSSNPKIVSLPPKVLITTSIRYRLLNTPKVVSDLLYLVRVLRRRVEFGKFPFPFTSHWDKPVAHDALIYRTNDSTIRLRSSPLDYVLSQLVRIANFLNHVIVPSTWFYILYNSTRRSFSCIYWTNADKLVLTLIVNFNQSRNSVGSAPPLAPHDLPRLYLRQHTIPLTQETFIINVQRWYLW